MSSPPILDEGPGDESLTPQPPPEPPDPEVGHGRLGLASGLPTFADLVGPGVE